MDRKRILLTLIFILMMIFGIASNKHAIAYDGAWDGLFFVSASES